MALRTFSAEDRAKAAAAATVVRMERASRLRSDFHPDDENEWRELARAAGVRLPPYGIPCTTGRMSKWLARLGISLDDFLGWDGSKTLRDFPRRNPDWPLKAYVGLLLEHRDQMTHQEG